MAHFITSAGTEISVSAGLPATHDSGGFSALSFTKLDLVGDGGEYGPTDNEATFIPLNDPTVQKGQGARNYGQMQLQMAYSPEGDAGFTILKTAHSGRNRLSVKVEKPDGAIDYFIAICLSATTVIGGADTVLGQNATLSITSSIVEVAASS